MSLIVARKAEGQISVISDTKLTYPNHETKHSKTDPAEGVIKTVIINPTTCISFAGEIDWAEQALREISCNTPSSAIIEILKKYHILSSYKTEFILCLGESKPVIFKFKNNEYGVVETCWIGDQNAFNNFQKFLMTDVPSPHKEPLETESTPTLLKPNILVEEWGLSIEPNTVAYFHKLSAAMDRVINSGNISTVGGFKAHVIFNERFTYHVYFKSYTGNFVLTKQEQVIGLGTAGDGAYCVNFFANPEEYESVALHIRQANLGVVYRRLDNGLLRPTLYQKDEVDFCDFVKENFDLLPCVYTQNRFKKFLYEGIKAAKENNFLQAKELFTKAVLSAPPDEKARTLYFLGVTLLNLCELQNALVSFQEAIAIKPDLRNKIDKSLEDFKRINRNTYFSTTS